MKEVNCQLLASFESTKNLRQVLRKLSSEVSNDIGKNIEIELVLVEIFTNILKHVELLESRLIDVCLKLSKEKLSIQLVDDGKQFLPSLVDTIIPKDTKNIDLLSESGYGVPLIVNLTDSVRYERKLDKNYTTIVFNL